MSDGAPYDLNVTAGERYDRVFLWKTGPGGTLLPMTGFTAVFAVYAGQEPLLTSAGPTPDVGLTQEPAGSIGELDLFIGGDVTGSMLVPYLLEREFFTYRLDLVDNALNDNLIPFLYGFVNVGRRFGQ